jgi:hypothetical protein
MAESSSINLGLSVLPDYEGKDPNLYQELVRIYNAIRAVRSGADYAIDTITTGFNLEGSDTATTDSFNVAQFTTIYATYAEDVDYGEFVSATSSGIVKAQGFNTAPNIKPAIGFCSEGSGVLAGAIGPVCNYGLIVASGLTVGRMYCLAPDGGVIDFAAYEAEYLSLGAPLPVTWHLQLVGTAITTDRLLVQLKHMSVRTLKFVTVGFVTTLEYTERGYYG